MIDRPRCVAADADPAVNRLLAEVLTRAGFEVRHLDGPGDAAAAELGGVDLVVLGGSGSGVTASEVARSLQAAGGPPVVVLTNGGDPAAAALADSDAGVRAVAKPFTPAEFGTAVDALVGGG